MTRGRWAFGLTTAALLWGLAILPAAFLLPVYDSSSATTSGNGVTVYSHSSATLIAENGAGVGLLLVLAAPAVLAAFAWLGLHRTCRVGSRAGWRIAGGAVLLLAVLTFLTGFTIGPELLPCLALLIVGMSLTPTAA